MNIQFASKFLLQEDQYDTLEQHLLSLGCDEEACKYLMIAVRQGLLEPSKAIQIVKSTTAGIDETSAVGGGVTGGPTAATFSPGAGEQMAGKKAFKKVKEGIDDVVEPEEQDDDEDSYDWYTDTYIDEDAPRLAGDPAKTNKQGSKNLNAYSSVGFTKAPSAEQAGKKLKSIDVKELWEAQRYSQFKKETSTRSKSQQMHEAAKMIHKKLDEVGKILEFANQMRLELSEGEEMLEYNHNTKKVFDKIHTKVVEVFSKVKKLG